MTGIRLGAPTLFRMARFYINLRQASEYILDQEGSDLADVSVAKAEAVEAARELLADSVRHARLSVERAFEVIDDVGTLVAVIAFTDVLAGCYQTASTHIPGSNAVQADSTTGGALASRLHRSATDIPRPLFDARRLPRRTRRWPTRSLQPPC